MSARDSLWKQIDSDVFRSFEKLSPIDAGKVRSEWMGVKRPEPRSRFAQGLVELIRANPATGVPTPAKGLRELSGVVRDASHFNPGTDRAKAFVEAGGTRLLLQFADPINDASNRARFPAWAAEWRRHGVTVDGWWRVNHMPTNLTPNVAGVDSWWPNAEDQAEIARLPTIYLSPCAGVLTLGKAPGAWPPAGGRLAAECFRENPQSDQTVTNSVTWWREAGLPDDRLIVMLQGYGTPFSPPVVQAREAVGLGIRQLMLYPVDGFSGLDVREIGRLVRS
jgi:hypothetical protein